jgi:hypothetical protein
MMMRQSYNTYRVENSNFGGRESRERRGRERGRIREREREFFCINFVHKIEFALFKISLLMMRKIIII